MLKKYAKVFEILFKCTYLQIVLRRVIHPFLATDSHALLMMISPLDNRSVSPINHASPSKTDQSILYELE